ncbi:MULTISPECIES: hypothetical protein [Agrobacterium]|uniref:hypothetical protein n=1 Tax=Agrobacterium TaxID=357 RepID=UPI001877B788|nr:MULTISPECIES: hypothetical protein [Agrobacterium]
MRIFAEFDSNGLPLAFYTDEIHGDDVPSIAIEITDEQWLDLLAGCGRRAWRDGEIVDVEPPMVEVPEPVTVVYGVDLWSRMTDTEADQVGAAMAEQPFRVRKIFETANSYRSDHELWPLLVQIATTLFGAERAAEILAPSV